MPQKLSGLCSNKQLTRWVEGSRKLEDEGDGLSPLISESIVGRF